MPEADGIFIRDMISEDIPPAAALERIIFGQEAWSEEDFKETLSLPFATSLAAVVNDRLVGLAVVRNGWGEGYLTNIFVAPENRRQGVARRLLKTLFSRVSSGITEGFVLEVREGNIPAIRLYESLGFSVVGMRKALYSHPTENALIMRRKTG
ncbi:MAG: ribosomal protein S18-alanine N-acetyltransferase [Lachnospiraceae bacterium]|nr:ribosomal protein S18-alanine N-acetyltransferase [Lachnospiraceae bacterium]